MERKKDFASQYARTQNRSDSARSPMVTSSSTSQPGPSQPNQSSQPSQARSQASAQNELSQIHDGLRYLMERVQQFSGNRRPAEPKPLASQPNVKQECQICHKLYANKTTLFRHYRAIHQEMNPERYHGCSVNTSVVSLDTSFREIQCSICGYIASTQNALDAHTRATHSNEGSNRPTASISGLSAHNRPSHNNEGSSNTATVTNSDNVTNKENVTNNVKNKMHKCEECACYFEERSKFDEHMKVQHGFEVVCKICNRNFLFKDIDAHVKDSHPDVYSKKRKENERESEKIIIQKVMKNRKGDRVRVFICTKCDIKMYDKIEVERHARSHKKGLKIKPAPRHKVSKDEDISVGISNDDNVILTCVDCDISTGSYDAAVEHSQSHIANAKPQFVTQLCEICDLKFEPLCYKKHIDLHYKNKEIHRESFKYFKYRSELLPTKDWFNCFDMADSEVKKMISESIYAHTRIVKMRVLHEGTYILFKCCKCDDFVEPAAVHNHTVNYDTCVKVRCSYPCNICKRTFNNRLTRNNHEKNHKSEQTYKNVLFNHENDKEFNEGLNAFKLQATNPERQKPSTSNNNDLIKVLYKCLCGLCLMRKESADSHKMVCPGRNAKESCPKCNNVFIKAELLEHCFEHHVNGTRIVIENITPEVIIIDSDLEIIEIDSSDEENAQNESLSNIKIENMRTVESTTIQSSCGETDEHILSAPETATKEANGNQNQIEAVMSGVEKTDNVIYEDECRSHHEFDDLNEMTDDNSQDTIAYENTETGADAEDRAPDMNQQGELKLVPTNFLLKPSHFRSIQNVFHNQVDIGALDREINNDIENVRQHIETTDIPVNEISVKEEKAWLYDPTDFSNICRRPSLRQIASSSNLSLEVESLLTDDEESDINPEIDETGQNDSHRDNTDNNISSKAPTDEEQTNDDTTSEAISNDILEIHFAITQNEPSNSEIHDRNEVIDDNAITENVNDIHEVTLNNPTENPNEQMADNEDDQDFDDDDLLTLGVENREESYLMEVDNNKKGCSEDADLAKNEENLSHIEEIETQEAAIECLTNGATNIDSNGSEDKNEDSITNQIEFNKVIDDTTLKQEEDTVAPSLILASEIIPTNLTHINKIQTVTSGETLEIQQNTEDVNYIETVVSNEIPEIQPNTQDKILTLKMEKEFQYMNINIKRELIVENETDCDISNSVDIKTESKENADTEYNEDKENNYIVDLNNDNYNNCSIV